METQPLSTRLRAETGAAHQAVEATPFARALFSGQVLRSDYSDYLHALHGVYAALEGALARCRRHLAVRAFELNQHLFAALAAAPDTPG